MNLIDFIKANPGFEQYIRGIIKNMLLLRNKSDSAVSAKIESNKKILRRRFGDKIVDELNVEFDRMVEELSDTEKYSSGRSFRANYSTALKAVKEKKASTKSVNTEQESKKVEKEKATDETLDKTEQEKNPDKNEGTTEQGSKKVEEEKNTGETLDKTEQEKNPEKNEDTAEQGSKKGEEEKATDETSGKTEQGSEGSNKDKNGNNGKPIIRYVAKDDCYQMTPLYGGQQQQYPRLYNNYSRSRKEAVLRESLGENFKKVFNNEDKKLLKTISKCDLSLLGILTTFYHVDWAKKYVEELAKGRKGSPDELPFKLEYDFSKAKKNSKNRKKIKKMEKIAKKSKYIAKYISGKARKWRKILGFGGAAVLAMGAGGALVADRSSNDQQQKPQQMPEYTDTAVPGGTSTTGKETTTTTQTIPRNTTTSSGKVVTTQDPVLPIKAGDSTQYIVFDEAQNSAKKLVLGSKVTMPAGLGYTEDSLGNGDYGEIGSPFRPAGDYVLDRVALWYNGELKANLGTEGTDINEAVEKLANELGVEPSEIIQKAHISLGENHVGPTGWIKADEFSMDDVKANISKTHDQIQQEKAEQQAQAQKSTQPHQQDHGDR